MRFPQQHNRLQHAPADSEQSTSYRANGRTQLERMRMLIEAAKSVNSSLDIDSLLEIILRTATTMVNADRGTVYLVDDATGELWSRVLEGTTTVEIRLPMGKGIAGHVAATGEVVNIEDAYADTRFNPDVDRATGYRTTTILCSPMRNKAGRIVGVFQLLNKRDGVFTPDDQEYIDALSVHAAIAIENAMLAQAMVQHERLSAVGGMASSIIHDIKNPMGTIRVYAQVIKQRSGNEETAKLADEIIRQVDRFVSMTQEILDFSRGVGATNFQVIDLREIMDAAFAFLEPDLEKRNVTLIKDVRFDGRVRVDPDKLMRVFYNLAGNAADAMPNGGTLTIGTSLIDGTVAFRFSDTGGGIPPDVKARIFDPFFTHGKKHGTGLGMAIVKKIVDDHNGSIEIQSEIGKGTTVSIVLPRGEFTNQP